MSEGSDGGKRQRGEVLSERRLMAHSTHFALDNTELFRRIDAEGLARLEDGEGLHQLPFPLQNAGAIGQVIFPLPIVIL